MLRFGTWMRLYWDQDDGQAWGVLSTKTMDGKAQDPLQDPLMAYFKAFQGDDITVKRAGMSRSWWSN